MRARTLFPLQVFARAVQQANTRHLSLQRLARAVFRALIRPRRDQLHVWPAPEDRTALALISRQRLALVSREHILQPQRQCAQAAWLGRFKPLQAHLFARRALPGPIAQRQV